MILFEPNVFIENNPITVIVANNLGRQVKREVYQINPKHRDRSQNKSKWSIEKPEEVGVFGWALENNSQDGRYYWGVSLHQNMCCVLGRTANSQNTKIARFECSAQPKIWHGYPVDYVKDPQHDCPNSTILRKWAKLNIITKPQIAKLIGGQGWKD
ncbi:MAG: hypothetical protein IJS62_05300 [Bacteroidales bacterium]|nr:hypothetical protein [Bacteroidales bacterium]